jgi:hypothetical protein
MATHWHIEVYNPDNPELDPEMNLVQAKNILFSGLRHISGVYFLSVNL